MSKERILITGANGFIGSITVKEIENRGNKIKKFKGDVREIADWQKNIEEEEIVFLIAGVRTETDTDFDVNAHSIVNLFESAIRLNKLPKRVILVSSQAVYMGNIAPFEESQKPLPTTIYGQSKLLGENIAGGWCRELNIPLVVLRYSTVLGANVKEKNKMSGPLFAWTKAALSGLPIKVFQDGNQTRDYVHIDDIVSANILATRLPDGIYNVGGNTPIKLIELANWIKKAAGNNSEIIIAGGKASISDPREMFSDTAKIESYGWKPKKTAKEAIYEFVASKQIF